MQGYGRPWRGLVRFPGEVLLARAWGSARGALLASARRSGLRGAVASVWGSAYGVRLASARRSGLRVRLASAWGSACGVLLASDRISVCRVLLASGWSLAYGVRLATARRSGLRRPACLGVRLGLRGPALFITKACGVRPASGRGSAVPSDLLSRVRPAPGGFGLLAVGRGPVVGCGRRRDGSASGVQGAAPGGAGSRSLGAARGRLLRRRSGRLWTCEPWTSGCCGAGRRGPVTS